MKRFTEDQFTTAYKVCAEIEKEWGSLTQFDNGTFQDTETTYQRSLARFQDKVVEVTGVPADQAKGPAEILQNWFFAQYA